MIGNDLSLVEEIQRRHGQVAGTAEEEFLLADAQGDDSTQQTVPHKRGLDDDDEVYAAKKQQVLRQIRQEAAGTELAIIKQHAQGSMSILVCSSCMVAGGALPADSMIENGMQSMLAIEAQKQQQELSINQQAQRWTVQMYANKLGLPAAACTADKLRAVRAAAGKIWTRERCLPTIQRLQDGALVRVWFEPGSNTTPYVPEEDPHLFAEARMKYSLAYKGGYEAADRANFDTWTYPAETGAQVLQAAFQNLL